MGEAVIFFVERRVVDAKRSGEVKHHATSVQKLRCQVVADFVRGGEENHIHTGAEFTDIRHRLQWQIHNAFQLRMQVRD